VKPLRVLSLFAGIGGFDLGLERTGGFETVAFCEINKYCQRVLAKHWPKVPCYDDVCSLTADRLAADGIAVDAICGGFPCQDISVAGAGAGLAGERSGLWREYARLIGELRPRYVIVENVAALLGRGLGTVLGDLAAIGYDAEWHCIPASAVGAPHRRDRVWIVANANGEREPQSEGRFSDIRGWSGNSSEDVANTSRAGLSLSRQEPVGTHREQGRRTIATSDWWTIEPDVGRVAHGIPSRVDRLGALGNAVVPQIPEMIGRAILQSISNSKDT
jgi:DNA (cytosine-5)-methyltransferase 1